QLLRPWLPPGLDRIDGVAFWQLSEVGTGYGVSTHRVSAEDSAVSHLPTDRSQSYQCGSATDHRVAKNVSENRPDRGNISVGTTRLGSEATDAFTAVLSYTSGQAFRDPEWRPRRRRCGNGNAASK